MIIYTFKDYKYESLHVSCKDFAFIRQAAKQAYYSNHHRFRLGATVVKRGSVLGHGYNIPKKGPSTPPYRESIHAEVNAIKSVKNPAGATVYVARLDAKNNLAVAKPCEYCIEHMKEVGIDRVVFSVSNTNAQSFYINSVEWNGHVKKTKTTERE
jgi:tRNA(Arg) A34 adenosine deaminase TadA